MKVVTKLLLSAVVVALSVCSVIGFTVYITGSAYPLWGLLVLSGVEYKETDRCKNCGEKISGDDKS